MVVRKQTPIPTIKFQTIPTRTILLFKKTEDLDVLTKPLRPVVELTTPQRKVTLEQTQQRDRLPEIDDRKDKANPNRKMLKATQMRMSKLQPKF